MKPIKIKIYQINSDRDPLRLKFFGFEEMHNIFKSKGYSEKINSEMYDEVYSGDVDCHKLESIYSKFNMESPPFHRGHSLSVSDVVQVIEAPELAGRISFYNGSKIYAERSYVDSKKYNNDIANAKIENMTIHAVRLADHHVPSVEHGFYFCDNIGFKKIDFDPFKTQKPDNLLRVVAKEPGKPAYVADVKNHYKSFQQAVGGCFQTFPLDENATFILNEEGKIHGFEANIIVNNELLVGTVFIAGISDDEDFHSLTDDQVNNYLEMFKQAEIKAGEDPSQNEGMKMI